MAVGNIKNDGAATEAIKRQILAGRIRGILYNNHLDSNYMLENGEGCEERAVGQIIELFGRILHKELAGYRTAIVKKESVYPENPFAETATRTGDANICAWADGFDDAIEAVKKENFVQEITDEEQ